MRSDPLKIGESEEYLQVPSHGKFQTAPDRDEIRRLVIGGVS